MNRIGRIEIGRRYILIFRSQAYNITGMFFTAAQNAPKRYTTTKTRIQRLSEAIKNFECFTHVGHYMCLISVYQPKTKITNQAPQHFDH